jgi:uncharacterized protein with PIN domain
MSGLDRVRPRTMDDDPRSALTAEPLDSEGKRALFSASSPAPARGAVTVECSSCGVESVLSAAQWVRAAVPSVHLPVVKRDYPSWMRCPACRKRTWVKPHFHV